MKKVYLFMFLAGIGTHLLAFPNGTIGDLQIKITMDDYNPFGDGQDS